MSSLKCHRERMKPKYSLEDYIHEMESRSLQQATEEEELDVYQQLHKKEKDLILAAELGKALLEKNEELSRKNERIAEEYSQKLETGAADWFHVGLILVNKQCLVSPIIAFHSMIQSLHILSLADSHFLTSVATPSWSATAVLLGIACRTVRNFITGTQWFGKPIQVLGYGHIQHGPTRKSPELVGLMVVVAGDVPKS
uniref:Uncharacterized protein n=1 Tax=Timema poppense TaxID=170557 RepID=A0A7R9CUA8_TIMPO|nr:unnamed protein product [Timema poppensis]